MSGVYLLFYLTQQKSKKVQEVRLFFDLKMSMAGECRLIVHINFPDSTHTEVVQGQVVQFVREPALL